MTIRKEFWKTKKLGEMSVEEWEALCDGCGICCLYKVEDAGTGRIDLTSVACRFLDLETCRCRLYGDRKKAMPTCIQLTPSKVRALDWLPATCAYRLIMEGKPLPDWHPLVSGDPQSVHRAGISVRGRCIPESEANMSLIENYIIQGLEPLKTAG